jgi:hypothetical protein
LPANDIKRGREKMATIEEFINIRKSIEALVAQITLCLNQDEAQRSREHLDHANRQLKELAAMVSNDVQTSAVDRLTRQLQGLESKVEAMATRRPGSRKPGMRKTSGKKAAEKKIETPVRPAVGEEPLIVIFERP